METKTIAMVKVALKSLFAAAYFRVLFAVIWILLFVLLYFLPVWTTPGNDVRFQARIFGAADYALLLLLSGMSALVILMQIKIFGSGRHAHAGETAIGGMGAVAGVVSSVFTTATCGLCVAALFSFLGFGTILALLEYRWYIAGASGILLLASLYLSTQRLVNGCRSCKVSAPN